MEEGKSLRSLVLFKALDHLSGHSKPADKKRSQFQRGQSVPIPSSPTDGRRTASYDPPPRLLPHIPPRPRCITPPLDNSKEEESIAFHDQAQSRLFCLPEEILLNIYECVIGNRVLHIVRRRGKLGHTSCKSTGEPDVCKEAKCRGFKLPTGLYVLSGNGSGDLIQLLQTCRKVYVDAIDILYTSNIFDIDSLESMISLSCAILSQRFDSIQNLQLDLRFSLSLYFSESSPSSDYLRWSRVWAIIGSMKALQHLWIRISWPRPRYSAMEEKRMMEPLWMVPRLRTYLVSLPPAFEGKDVDWSDAPFEIIRRTS